MSICYPMVIPAAAAAATTWDAAKKASSITLSGSDLVATQISNDSEGSGVLSILGHSSSKFYFEIVVTNMIGSGNVGVGIGNASTSFGPSPSGAYIGASLNSIGWNDTGIVFLNAGVAASIQTYVEGDTCCVAADFDNSRIWFRTNGGNWNNNVANDPATNVGGINISTMNAGPYYAAINTFRTGEIFTANFGATAYAQTPPSGFGNL